MSNFYITSTLPYVNADPHLGFALEIIQADTVARYHKLIGDKVIFNTGTDEHGLKIYRAALKQKKSPQDYVDEHAAKFDKLKEALNLSYTNFIRTTDARHVEAAQEFWERCDAKGDIYKDKYSIKYCVGCELEKTESELENDRCPIHPNLEIEIIEEENYFFRWSKYQKPLLEFYERNPNFVIPDFRFNEIKSFVKQGLNDFSISRLKKKMPWGVPVPGDPEHVLFVWFDALVNYISTLGWPKDEKTFKAFWPGVQVAGKDNLRQQSAMWQAMLMSVGLPNSKQIFIHGFITSEGQKISKSLGNIVDPFWLVEKYGTDAVRYYLLREIPAYADGDFSETRFKEVYNADLANNLGNLVSRVARLAEKSAIKRSSDQAIKLTNKKFEGYRKAFEEFRLNEAASFIWDKVTKANKFIDTRRPWEQEGKGLEETLTHLVSEIREIAFLLKPFLPETAEKIEKQFVGGKINKFVSCEIKAGKPLFPRLT